MKRTNRLLLLTALGMTLAGVTAQAQTEPADQPAGGPGPRGVPPLGQVLKGLLQKYDVNQDGQLDQTEMAALQKDIDEGKIQPPMGPGPRGRFGPGPGPLPKEILDKYDVNKDGHLDEEERAALHKDIEAGKVQLPGRRGAFPPPPPLTAKQVLEKFDADKDGKLDETELNAFLQDMKQHQPMPRGRRGPPPGEAPPAEQPQQ